MFCDFWFPLSTKFHHYFPISSSFLFPFTFLKLCRFLCQDVTRESSIFTTPTEKLRVSRLTDLSTLAISYHIVICSEDFFPIFCRNHFVPCPSLFTAWFCCTKVPDSSNEFIFCPFLITHMTMKCGFYYQDNGNSSWDGIN